MAGLNFSYSVPITECIEEGITSSDFFIEGIAINSTTTENNHKFLPEELRLSASSLTGVPLLVDHDNSINAIKGRVLLGTFDEGKQNVKFKARVMDEEIKKMIKQGLINSVSVGASVKEIQEDSDGSMVPHGIVFKELSLVAVPADPFANFSIAMKAQLIKEKEDMMGKCPECGYEGKMKPMDKKMKSHESFSINKKEDKMTVETTQEVKSEIVENKAVEVKEEVKSESKTEAIVEPKLEEKVTEKVDPISPILAKLEAQEKALNELKDELAVFKKKVEEKEIKQEVKEAPKQTPAKEESEEEESEEEDEAEEKFHVIQDYGSLRGGAFTVIRNY